MLFTDLTFPSRSRLLTRVDSMLVTLSLGYCPGATFENVLRGREHEAVIVV